MSCGRDLSLLGSSIFIYFDLCHLFDLGQLIVTPYRKVIEKQ